MHIFKKVDWRESFLIGAAEPFIACMLDQKARTGIVSGARGSRLVGGEKEAPMQSLEIKAGEVSLHVEVLDTPTGRAVREAAPFDSLAPETMPVRAFRCPG